ncbi:TPA: hypothetical protein RQK40_004102 [Vibrio vulnificus]|nr:hypothetical protein [Vibrio vulnificus]HDY7873635.1 hypothetical protein [Vibrio vulnificus]
MHSVTFYPVGNGDTSLIETEHNKFILMDFYQASGATDSSTPVYDIDKALRAKLKESNKSSFDVVAFTHADRDHINGSTEFFYLEHAKKYQGEDRIVIDELWVPAAMLLERVKIEERSSEFAIWKKECIHRLKNKSGIKVFSMPDDLIKLIESWDMTVNELSGHIIEAGTILPNFNLDSDGLEFFVHSPFMKHCDDSNGDIKKVRNEASLIFNVRFKAGANNFDYLAIGDSEAQVLEDIVSITKFYKNEDRLKWDLFNIPHHCSYLALAEDGEKGKDETIPKDKVKELLQMGQPDCYMVCSSEAFKSGHEAEDSIQPPHIQARRCYEKYLGQVKGRKFIVTGEHGGKKKPEPVVVEITSSGLTIKSLVASAAIATAAATPARAG